MTLTLMVKNRSSHHALITVFDLFFFSGHYYLFKIYLTTVTISQRKNKQVYLTSRIQKLFTVLKWCNIMFYHN